MRRLAALALVLALAGCGDDAPDANSVKWSNYADGLLSRIDKAGGAGDCEQLQQMFDNAPDSDPDLLHYIDATMKDAGC